MNNLRMLLMVGSLLPLFSVNIRAGQTVYEEGLLTSVSCEEPKDCADMGYLVDITDCAGPALKCPWDLTKAMCRTIKDVETETKFRVPILYGDGTVSREIKTLNEKAPIGIVTDEEKRLAISLVFAKKDRTPGLEEMPFSDVMADTGLQNCAKNDLEAGCGSDGRANTNILLKETSGTYYAAQAVNKFEPKGCTAAFCKKGKWFLPSYPEVDEFGESYNIFRLGDVLAYIGAVYFKDVEQTEDRAFWTSTEENRYNQWTGSIKGGSSASWKDKYEYFLRPMVKY